MHLNITGYITDKTSYGLVTLNLINELGKINTIHLYDQNAIKFEYIPKTPILDKNTPSLRIAHQFDMAQRIGRGPAIGYTFSELNRLTEKEKIHLNSLDLVVVPTAWQQSVYASSGINSVVAHAGYDPSIFKPLDYKHPKCVFLSVGKWEVRKQQTQIVEAFKKAFGQKDNVELWLSCSNRFMQAEVEKYQREYKKLLGEKLTIIDYVNSPKSLASIMQQSFCFVAPSLAEGWNLPLLEAMACGKYNIATNYSGHTEFCTSETSLLIEPTGLVPAVDGKWFLENNEINCGEWCSYELDDLITLMRQAYEMYNSGRTLNEAAAKKASLFTWANSARQMTDNIRDFCRHGS
jgi:glycosyltransferase involved in cell wall biosynthesis